MGRFPLFLYCEIRSHLMSTDSSQSETVLKNFNPDSMVPSISIWSVNVGDSVAGNFIILLFWIQLLTVRRLSKTI